MPEAVSRIRVRYVETDQMGIVHHSAYLAWLEVARTDSLRQRGLPYAELEKMGVQMPVLGIQVDYIRPALYDDEIVVVARLVKATPVRFTFSYEVRRGDTHGELLCRGETRHAAVGPEGRPRRLQKDILERIGGHVEHP
ncbi:MAG: thioesterase family protein [Acidobacteriota bacterium]